MNRISYWEPGISASSAIPPEGLRERSKRAKRARIVAAARRLFERKGFEATTAREICRHAGIGTGTLFLYARDKRELLFLVFRDEARALYRSGLKKAERASSLIDALMCLFGEFIEFYSRRPALSRWILEELFWREHEPGGMGALTSEYLGCVQRILSGPRSRGELRSDVPPQELSAAFFAHYSFWVQAWLTGGMVSREQAETRLRRALELQLEGLAPTAPRRRRT